MFQQLVGTVLPGQGGDGSTWECIALGCHALGMSSVHVCLWLRRRLGAIGYEGPTVWAGPDASRCYLGPLGPSTSALLPHPPLGPGACAMKLDELSTPPRPSLRLFAKRDR